MRRSFLAGVVVLAAAGVVGCGAEDFPNDPRPPAAVELSAKVDNHRVVVAPAETGAGIATFTISNQSADDVALDLMDPTGNKTGPTTKISAGAVGTLQVELKQGDYEFAPDVDSIDSGTLKVGPERPSAQNDLLLP
jgi:hypothetical protein